MPKSVASCGGLAWKNRYVLQYTCSKRLKPRMVKKKLVVLGEIVTCVKIRARRALRSTWRALLIIIFIHSVLRSLTVLRGNCGLNVSVSAAVYAES